jgi:hypothetical protein
MTSITVMPGAIAAYTVSPWNNTQACRPKKDDKNSSLADGTSSSNSNANYTKFLIFSMVLTRSTGEGLSVRNAPLTQESQDCPQA